MSGYPLPSASVASWISQSTVGQADAAVGAAVQAARAVVATRRSRCRRAVRGLGAASRRGRRAEDAEFWNAVVLRRSGQERLPFEGRPFAESSRRGSLCQARLAATGVPLCAASMNMSAAEGAPSTVHSSLLGLRADARSSSRRKTCMIDAGRVGEELRARPEVVAVGLAARADGGVAGPTRRRRRRGAGRRWLRRKRTRRRCWCLLKKSW